MTDPVAPPLTLPELEQIVREVDRSAFLVPPRILRRVIKMHRGVTFLGWHGAHRESYTIRGDALRTIVDSGELGLPPGAPCPETVSLLVRPEAEELLGTPRSAVLARYWRLLFHARVHAALDLRQRTGTLDDEDVQRRIERIGRLEFEEARAVLRQDGRLVPPRDDRGVYYEFAAAVLELRHFEPWRIGHVFPAVRDTAAVAAVLREDVDAARLFAATRPAGAPAPGSPTSAGEEGDDEEGRDDEADDGEAPEVAYRRLSRRAEAAAGRGNFVRAAILWTRAAQRGGPSLSHRARAAGRAEVERLVRRLQPAVGFTDAALDRWKRALPALLDRSARGFWTAEARLLYDLQKVSNDYEHEVFTVDLVEWARSRGRRPLRRALPHLREVMTSNHLHRASRRLPATRLPRDARERIGSLLSAAVAQVEEQLRQRFRPLISATLTENGCRPRNLPERVGFDKLIEELLDRIVDRGFLTLGDLRDAFSRSNLKLPDLSGAAEFFRGDRLLRTDGALAEALDGVYRRGEVYLRGLQRVSALAFGTRVGRFATLYLVLPYGGAFVGLKGVGHLLELFGANVELADPLVIAAVGTVVLGLVNSAPFRAESLAGVRRIGRAATGAVHALCRWLGRQPWVRAVAQSRVFTLFWRFGLKPLAVSVPLCAVGSLAGSSTRTLAEAEVGLVLALSLLLNSRLGRDAEEILAEGAVRLWKRCWSDFLPGVFRWVVTVFHQFLETVERFLYAVDEWLRFRRGQGRSSLVVRAVLGFVWFFIAYLVRFYVNLLIEPQVNPIKHFPVVTVSHKIILPLSKTLTILVAAPLMPLGKVAAYFIAGVTVLLLPGIFGFLVWEMKENWRLYEANRAETLRPVVVGHHGETMSRLLRPGFHSGTVPKLFARLRRAERRALAGKPRDEVPRRLDALEHVEHAVARFVDREFLALLRGCRAWASAPAPEVRSVGLATNQIRVTLTLQSQGDDLTLAFDEEAGVLNAGIAAPGWLATLDEPRQRAVGLALRGLWKMSAVARVRPEPAAPASGGGDPAATWSRWVECWSEECERPPAVPRDPHANGPVAPGTPAPLTDTAGGG